MGREESTLQSRLLADLTYVILQDHRRMRKPISQAMSERALAAQESIILNYLDLLVFRLREKAEASHVVDLQAWMNFTTFDILGERGYSVLLLTPSNR